MDFLSSFFSKKATWTGLAALLVGVSFFSGLTLGSTVGGKTLVSTSILFPGGSESEPEGVDFSPLWRAWSTLEEKYVPATTTDPVTAEDRVWGTIEGLAASYGDPYTIFLPPAETTVFEEDISGSFSGVGMEIGIRGNTLTVIAPLKGTPAQKAGIRPGDRIIAIDGEPTDGLSVEEGVKRIRGEQGTIVKLLLSRDDESELKEIEVMRDVISIPTINSYERPDGIFVIELYNFSAVSPQSFRDALREFVNTASNKLILDLRGNPGGYLEASVDMASWFLPVGSVVVEESFGGNEDSRVHRSRGYDIFNKNLKMVILVNRGSASASEILAGALQEHGIAKLVGERTFGKGSVQELVKITPETALKVTIARWLTPHGISISDGGLTPDVEVELTGDDAEAGLDPQLDKAVAYLLGH